MEIIARTSGRPWSEFVAERVFSRRASTLPARRRLRRSQQSDGYTDNNKLLDAPDWPAVRPGGAFMSTVLDLAKWDAVLYERIGPEGGHANADVVAREAERRVDRCLRLRVAHQSARKPAAGLAQRWPAGVAAQFHRYLDDRVSVIMLMNSDDADDETILTGVAELYLPDRKSPYWHHRVWRCPRFIRSSPLVH